MHVLRVVRPSALPPCWSCRHSVPENHPYYAEIRALLDSLTPSLAEAGSYSTHHASHSASGISLSGMQPPTASLLTQVLTQRILAAQHEDSDTPVASDRDGFTSDASHASHAHHQRQAFPPATPVGDRPAVHLPRIRGWQLPMPQPQPPPPLRQTPLVMVTNRRQLQDLQEVLLKVRLVLTSRAGQLPG